MYDFPFLFIPNAKCPASSTMIKLLNNIPTLYLLQETLNYTNLTARGEKILHSRVQCKTGSYAELWSPCMLYYLTL